MKLLSIILLLFFFEMNIVLCEIITNNHKEDGNHYNLLNPKILPRIRRENRGNHEVLDVWEIPLEVFEEMSKDFDRFDKQVKRILDENGLESLGVNYFKFLPGFGITAVWLCGTQSHMSIHTWPENGYAALDIYSYDESETSSISKQLVELLQGKKVNKQQIARGEPKSIFRGFPYNADLCLNGEVDQTTEYTVIRNATILDEMQSKFEKIVVFESKKPDWGKCLVIGEFVQFCTGENDVYTASLVQKPMNIFKSIGKKDLNVLIVGGGDGWVASYLLEKYPEIAHITLVDIDKAVTEMTNKHFMEFFNPQHFWLNNLKTAKNPENKIDLFYDDASLFLQTEKNIPNESLDLIIIDCTDYAVGTAKVLYTTEFYENVFKKLKKGGAFTQQMNQDSPVVTPFIEELRKKWEQIGFVTFRWSTDIEMYGGSLVFGMGGKI